MASRHPGVSPGRRRCNAAACQFRYQLGSLPSIAPGDTRIPTPDSRGITPIITTDGAVQARFGYASMAAGNTAAVRLVPGLVANGPAMLCE